MHFANHARNGLVLHKFSESASLVGECGAVEGAGLKVSFFFLGLGIWVHFLFSIKVKNQHMLVTISLNTLPLCTINL